jgi:Na+/proline symporter
VLFVNRISIMAVMLSSAVISLSFTDSIILDWSYLATSFRGVVACLPLIGALFFPRRVPKKCVFVSMITGPVILILGKLFPLPFDSIFLGLAGNFLILGAGFMVRSFH